MKEQLITFETAKLAKEKGFDIPYINVESSYPTQSLLQKWLRDECNIFTQVIISDHPEGKIYSFCIKQGIMNPPIRETFLNFDEDNWFKTYEEALEKGLKEALKLIK